MPRKMKSVDQMIAELRADRDQWKRLALALEKRQVKALALLSGKTPSIDQEFVIDFGGAAPIPPITGGLIIKKES